jgi:hypothetical protein
MFKQMTRQLAILAGAAATAVMLAGTAQATPQEDAFLNALRAQGFQLNPLTTPMYLTAGNRVCDYLRDGVPSTNAKNDIAALPGLNINDMLVSTLVTTAHQQLCPATATNEG